MSYHAQSSSKQFSYSFAYIFLLSLLCSQIQRNTSIYWSKVIYFFRSFSQSICSNKVHLQCFCYPTMTNLISTRMLIYFYLSISLRTHFLSLIWVAFQGSFSMTTWCFQDSSCDNYSWRQSWRHFLSYNSCTGDYETSESHWPFLYSDLFYPGWHLCKLDVTFLQNQ